MGLFSWGKKLDDAELKALAEIIDRITEEQKERQGKNG